MTVEFVCPGCSQRLRVPDDRAGTRARCPKCQGIVEIPRNEAPVDVLAIASGDRTADVIDLEIFGQEMQYVEITLDPGEMVIAEAGGMMYMSPGIKMETVFGDPSRQSTGIMGKLKAAGKRLLTGESLFMTTFQNTATQRLAVAFAAPYPGKLLTMHLDELGGEIICQKDSFLCAARGVEIGIAFQRKILTGLFGGEGFIMQRITGDGIAVVHAGGTLLHRTLAPGETLQVDTGCLVALTPSVNYDIQMVKGFKNVIFGGEGLFLATLTGPGQVWLQSLPFARLAGRVLANASPSSLGRKDEGSLLGGLGNMFMGDNE
ncbi:MAG: TIGR00266 family protein [Planctomycetota bacterium]|nr:TIGR00266 family protein [Planctomycetota bacterium]MDA1179862.1 TIGR00266 family protein [Planctomycetota bacterium]